MSMLGRWMVSGMLLLLAACSSSHHSDTPAAPTARFQVVHASPDAPRVTVLIDGQVWCSCLNYGDGLGEATLPAGSHTVTVQANTPAGPVVVLGPQTVDFLADNDFVIAIEGVTANISSHIFPHPLSVVASTATRVQILHAAPEAPAVSVYVTAPGADLTTSQPLGGGSVAYQAAIGPLDVPSGSYQIRVTPAGVTSPVLFDSGTISLVGGTDLVITAVQNTGPGASPIVLAAVDAWGNNGLVYDVNTPAQVRFVHAAGNVPAMNITATLAAVTTPIVNGLGFSQATPYLPVVPGDYSFSFVPTAGVAALGTQALTLWAGQERTVYALGSLTSFVTESTWDNRRRLATAAKLRIVHGSLSSGSVDLYLTAPAAGVATGTPWFANVPFQGFSAFQEIAAGSYDLTLTAPGTKTVIAGPVTLTVDAFGIYTVVVTDAVGGIAPTGFLLLDDFAG